MDPAIDLPTTPVNNIIYNKKYFNNRVNYLLTLLLKL